MQYLQLTLVTLALSLFTACGGKGTSGGGGGGASSSSLTGSIKSQTGDSAAFQSWIVALFDRDSGEARVAEIDSFGGYILNSVDQGKTYTMVLLSPDFKLSSVFSMISADQEKKVYQWFKPAGSELPLLVYNGPNFEFSDTSKVALQTFVADDSDSDGIPDGMETVVSDAALEAIRASDQTVTKASNSDADLLPIGVSLSTVDTDDDGVVNATDPDIDGDGLANWFDGDDDANSTLDIFDIDANADLVTDSGQTIGDHYFGSDVTFATTQYIVQDDGKQYLQFTTKLSSGLSSSTVTARGPTTLFDESVVSLTTSDGTDESQIWDFTLLDDGQNGDDLSGDGIFARKIKLKSGKTPKANQMVFIQVGVREFAYTFPNITAGSISYSYSSSDRVITKSGTPFGSGQSSYLWSVTVYNSDSIVVHSSASIDGTTDTFTIPSDVMEAGSTYTAKIFAQSLDQVPGYPTMIVESAQNTLN